MAKRRKKAAPVRRRRRIGGIKSGSSPIMNIALGAVGAVAGSLLGDKVLPNLDPKIKGAAWIGLGYVIPTYLLKSATGSAIGVGVGISGALILGKSLGLISGLPMISGVPMISGYNRAKMLSGVNNSGVTPVVQNEPFNGSSLNRFMVMSAR